MTEQGREPNDAVDLYVRLSNADDTADSLERQERDLREWAARENLTVRNVWKDYGRSGFKRDVRRDGFESALKAVLSGEVTTLAVWKLDRLSRRGAGHVGKIMDDLEHTGGRVYFLQDRLDTSDSSDRIMIALVSEFARKESDNTSVRVKSRKASDRRAGRYLGGSAPYGYTVDADRRLRPSLEPISTDSASRTEFDLVQELVRRVLDGESLLSVARDWNAQGVPSPRYAAWMRRLNGGTLSERDLQQGPPLWRPSTLSNLLRSPTLVGLMTEMVEKKTEDGRMIKLIQAYRDPATGDHVSLMADGYAAIATPSEQARALALMDGRLRRYGRGTMPTRTPKSLLGTLAKCASCGRSLTTFGESYRCKRTFVDGKTCGNPVSVDVAALDDAVRRAWSRRLAASEHDAEILARVADRWLDRFDPAALHEHRELKQRIEDLEQRRDLAHDDYYERGALDAASHARITGRLGERLDALRSRLAQLPSPEADLSALLDPELSLPGIEEAPVAEARDLLRLVIDGVLVKRAPRRGARFDPAERLRFLWVE
jgi:DNA invertase Pin-like site-specific DNA recombinase